MFPGSLFQHFGPYTLNEHAAKVLLSTNGTIIVFSSGVWDCKLQSDNLFSTNRSFKYLGTLPLRHL